MWKRTARRWFCCAPALAVITAMGSGAAAWGADPPVETPQDNAALGARITELEREMAQMTASRSATHLDFGLPIHGFAEVNFGESGGGQDIQKLKGFNAGAMEFYLTPQLGDRVRSLIELQFEYDEGGSLGADLERTQIGYQYADNSVAWLGRFHIPFGYWNTAFHHGAFIQTSLSRPRFIQFEDKGGVLPAHAVGPWISGKLGTRAGQFAYDVYVANGDKIGTDPQGQEGELDFNAFTDDNNSKMIGAKLAWEFSGALDGLEAGAHAYRDRVNAYDGNSAMLSSNRVTMIGAYAAYDTDEMQFIGEYYHYSNNASQVMTGTPGTNGSHASNLWFVQTAYTIGDFVPYLRFEQAALDKEDPYFASQTFGRPYKAGSIGVRYNLDPRAAVKVEASRWHEDEVPNPAGGNVPSANYSRLQAQLSIRF